MSYPFPPMLDQLVREELATGAYRSEDDVLVEAMQACAIGMRLSPAFKRASPTWTPAGCVARRRGCRIADQVWHFSQRMTHHVVLTDRAARDLDEAYRWYAEQARRPPWPGTTDSSTPSTAWPTIPSVVRLRRSAEAIPRNPSASLRAATELSRTVSRAEQTVIVLHVRHTARREASREDLFEPET